MMSVKKSLKFLLRLCCAAVILAAVYVFAVNGYVIFKTKDRIVDADEAASISDVDCILVLGAAVKPDKTPSNCCF